MTQRLSKRGFSLIELIVVMAILATGLAIAVPNFMELGRRNAVKAEAREFKNVLEKARMEAVRSKQSLTATITGNRCIISVSGGGAILSTTQFDRAQVDTGGVDPRTINWSTRGMTTNNCTIGFVGAGATYKVIISPAGNIRIARQ
jgi:prepilin-type N-terminal cleavage/methylation domain-containing protein